MCSLQPLDKDFGEIAIVGTHRDLLATGTTVFRFGNSCPPSSKAPAPAVARPARKSRPYHPAGTFSFQVDGPIGAIPISLPNVGAT